MSGGVVFLRNLSVALLLLVQGCVTAPKTTDEATQIAALERWNQCLERFDNDAYHYCDGHRRDVLATFPAYLGTQVNSKLTRQASFSEKNELLRARLRLIDEAGRLKTNSETP